MADKNEPRAFILPMILRDKINLFKGRRDGVSVFMSSYPQHLSVCRFMKVWQAVCLYNYMYLCQRFLSLCVLDSQLFFR